METVRNGILRRFVHRYSLRSLKGSTPVHVAELSLYYIDVSSCSSGFKLVSLRPRELPVSCNCRSLREKRSNFIKCSCI